MSFAPVSLQQTLHWSCVGDALTSFPSHPLTAQLCVPVLRCMHHLSLSHRQPLHFDVLYCFPVLRFLAHPYPPASASLFCASPALSRLFALHVPYVMAWLGLAWVTWLP